MNGWTSPTPELRHRSFWKNLCPFLAVTDLPWTGEQAPPVEISTDGYETEGYVVAESVCPEALCSSLHRGIERIRNARLPTPFLFMYDETWQVYEALQSHISDLLGEDHLVGGDFWAWSLAPQSDARGWAPHVDAMFKVPDLMPDGRPRYASLWVSLNETTTSNGCMHIVPRSAGATPASGDLDRLGVPLPVPPGSLLSWSPDIVHWSGEVEGGAEEGRSSFAIFGQRGDIAPLTWDMIRIGEPVPFDYRLGMVCRQLTRYQNSTLHPMLSEMDDWAEFAAREERRFSRFLALMAEVTGRRPEGVR